MMANTNTGEKLTSTHWFDCGCESSCALYKDIDSGKYKYVLWKFKYKL